MTGEQRSAAPAVELDDLRFAFSKRRVLNGVSFAVQPGSVFALLARNGEGKTTIVRCLLGQLRPAAGIVRVLGRDPWRKRPLLMRDIGVTPEAPDAPPDRTPQQVLDFCWRIDPEWDRDTALERLERLRIPIGQQISSLSRGQKAQLHLAIALASRPKLLVLDDPTLGLDALARRELYEELIGDLADRGTTVLLTTHDLDGVERLADRVAVLHQGTIVAEADLDELKREWGDRLDGDAALEEIFVQLVGEGGAA